MGLLGGPTNNRLWLMVLVVLPIMAVVTREVDYRKEFESFRLSSGNIHNGDDELLGIITDGDLRRAIAEGADIRAMTASCLMTPNPVCVHPEASLQQAIEIMEDRPSQIAVLPVTDEASGKPLGILRLHDVYQPREL